MSAAASKSIDSGSFIPYALKAVDSSISDESIQTVLQSLQFPVAEFWNLTESDIISIVGDENKEQASKILNTQQYLKNVEHWDEMKIVVDSESVTNFLSKESPEEAFSLDEYRSSEFVEQILKVTPQKSDTVVIYSLILRNFSRYSGEGIKLLGKQEVVDSFVVSSKFVTSADSVCWWSTAICRITLLESNRKLFAVSEIRDALVAVSEHASSADSVHVWCSAIRNITFLESSTKIFAVAEIRDAFVTVSKHATSADSVHVWCSAIRNIITLESNDKIFAVDSIRDAFVTVSKYATAADSVDWWCIAIRSITVLESNKKFFGVAAIRDAFVTISAYATSSESIRRWIEAIGNIISNFSPAQQVFSSSSELTETIMTLKNRIEQIPENDTVIAKQKFEWVENELAKATWINSLDPRVKEVFVQVGILCPQVLLNMSEFDELSLIPNYSSSSLLKTEIDSVVSSVTAPSFFEETKFNFQLSDDVLKLLRSSGCAAPKDFIVTVDIEGLESILPQQESADTSVPPSARAQLRIHYENEIAAVVRDGYNRPVSDWLLKQQPSLSSSLKQTCANLCFDSEKKFQRFLLDSDLVEKLELTPSDKKELVEIIARSRFQSSAAAASSSPESNYGGMNIALQNVNIGGSIIAGNTNCNIYAPVIQKDDHLPINDFLAKHKFLPRSLQQSLADEKLDNKDALLKLSHSEVQNINKVLSGDREALNKFLFYLRSEEAAVRIKEISKSASTKYRRCFQEQRTGGRTISFEETFSEMRIRSNVNRNSNNKSSRSSHVDPNLNSSSAASAAVSADFSSSNSPFVPEDLQQQDNNNDNDVSNQGNTVNSSKLPSIVTSGANVIVINGSAGIGKTWTARMLCIQQSVANTISLFVPLKNLKASGKEINSVADLLALACCDEYDVLTIEEQQLIAGGNAACIFYLDGYDEVQFSDTSSNMGKFLHNFVDPIKRQENLKSSSLSDLVRPCDHIVITSREERSANNNCNLDHRDAQVDHWNLLTWRDQQIRQYCVKWFTAMTNDGSNSNSNFDVEKAALDVVNALRAEYMQHFAGLPLFVNMLCELRLDGSSSSLDCMSPSFVFEEIFELFFSRSRERIETRLVKIASDYELSETKICKKLLQQVMNDAALAGYNQLVSPTDDDFTAISFVSKTNVSKTNVSKKPPLFSVLLESTGLARYVSSTKICFPHRSFIEFLCAKHASEHPETALIVPPVVDLSLPVEKQEKVPETILWTQKFATVWLILADFARRNEDEYQQEKKRTSLLSSVNYSKIHVGTFIKHLARVFYSKNKENDQKSDTNKGSEIACTVPLLRITMILPSSSCNQLLDAIKSEHAIHFKPPRHFFWLAERSGKAGALGALQWFEKNYQKDVTMDLLKRALGYALDHQELPAVSSYVDALVKRNVPISLEHAMQTGSAVGVTIAASKENCFDPDLWSCYLKLAFDRQQYDLVAALLMYGNWNNEQASVALKQFLPFSLPTTSVSGCSSDISPKDILALVISRLPSHLRVYNLKTQDFDFETRQFVADRCGVVHHYNLPSLFYFFIPLGSRVSVSDVMKYLDDVDNLAREMNIQEEASSLRDPLLACLSVAASRKDRKMFDALEWSTYLKFAIQHKQYDTSVVLLMNGDWKNNEDETVELLQQLPFDDVQFLKSSLNIKPTLKQTLAGCVLKLPSSFLQVWNSSTNCFESKSGDIVAASLGLTDVENCRVVVADFFEEASVVDTEQCQTSLLDSCLSYALQTCKENPKSEEYAVFARNVLVSVSHFVYNSETAEKWCNSAHEILLVNQQQNAKIFGTSDVYDSLVLVTKSWMSESTKVHVKFLEFLSEIVIPSENKVLFGTDTIRDILVSNSNNNNQSPQIQHDDESTAAFYFCSSICNLIDENEQNQHLFGVKTIRDYLVHVSSSCTDVRAASTFCSCVSNLCKTVSNNKILFSTELFRDALLSVSKYCICDEAAGSYCNAIVDLTSDGSKVVKKSQILFGVAGTCESLVDVSRYCISADSVRNWCSVICGLTSDNEPNCKIFGCELLRDALVVMRKYATSDDSVRCWCSAIVEITMLESNQKLFGVAEIRDALVTVSKYATSADIVSWWSHAIVNITEVESIEKIFGVEAIRDAFVSVSNYTTSPESVYYWSSAINNITVLESNQKLFGVAAIRDALVAVSKHATSADSVRWWSSAVRNITELESNQKLFGVSEIRNALLLVSKYCSDPDSAKNFCDSIWSLTCNDDNKILFGTASVRDALLIVSEYCTTPASASSFYASILKLTVNDKNKILFGTASVRDALLVISKYCTTPISATDFCGAIENIIDQNQSNGVLFATEVVRDAILSASAYMRSSYWFVCSGVYCCCRVISLFHERNTALFCVEETVKSLVKLSKIEIEKQSPESIYWFVKTVLSLLHSDKKLFNTTEIRFAVERFQGVVNDPEEVEKLEKETYALDNLSDVEYLDEARQLCVEFQKVVSGKTEVSSAAAAACATSE